MTSTTDHRAADLGAVADPCVSAGVVGEGEHGADEAVGPVVGEPFDGPGPRPVGTGQGVDDLGAGGRGRQLAPLDAGLEDGREGVAAPARRRAAGTAPSTRGGRPARAARRRRCAGRGDRPTAAPSRSGRRDPGPPIRSTPPGAAVAAGRSSPRPGRAWIGSAGRSSASTRPPRRRPDRRSSPRSPDVRAAARWRRGSRRRWPRRVADPGAWRSAGRREGGMMEARVIGPGMASCYFLYRTVKVRVREVREPPRRWPR